MPQPASRLDTVPPHVFVTIGQNIQRLQTKGVDIVRLDIGNPDMPPDESVINALYEYAMMPTNHGYSGYTGIPSFRKSIADFYKRRFEVELDADTEVLPLLGTKEGIVNLTMAYIDNGDIALVPEIGYPSYAMGTRLAGGTVEYIPMHSETFQLETSNISHDILKKAKILWVNYPNNPTGAVASDGLYNKLIHLCHEYDILLASDNPYVDITYDGYRGSSLLNVPHAKEVAVEFFSFSKTYNMAGWRIGAIVGNASALKHVLKVKSNIDSGHFKAVYESATVALETITDEWIQQRNDIYQQRRDRLYDVLPSIGLSAQLPTASLYIWAKIPALFDQDDVNFVNRMLEEAHVSLSPGSAYGPGGKGFVRLTVSAPDERLDVAMNRMVEWYSKLGS